MGRIVEFKARRNKNKNAMCDCCHTIGRVTILTYPITMFFLEDGYKKLKSKYHDLWLCDDCKRILIATLRSVDDGVDADGIREIETEAQE